MVESGNFWKILNLYYLGLFAVILIGCFFDWLGLIDVAGAVLVGCFGALWAVMSVKGYRFRF